MQPIIEVRPESVLIHHRFQVPIGGGDEADIGPDGAVASYALCPMIFLAMPEMTRRGAQIVIDYLLDTLPLKYRRPIGWTVTLATALVCLMGAWITGAETWRQYLQGIETVLAFAVPKWWVSIFVPYGLLSSAIYFFRRLIEAPPVARTDEAVA